MINRRQRDLLRNEIQEVSTWTQEINLHYPRKILVTGASGFIGQWIFAALLEMASQTSGTRVLCETSRYKDVAQNWFPELKKDYRADESESDFDLIFDLRLPATGETRAEQLEQSKYFFKGILDCKDRLIRGGRLVHPSSGMVYGDYRHSSNLCEKLEISNSKLTIYGETKLGIESLHNGFTANAIDLLTPRIFSVFGPMMRSNSPLIGNRFIQAASQKKDVVAIQSKDVFRDFSYISDVVKQLIYIGFEGSPIPNVNLGTGNIHDVYDFGREISSQANVTFYPGRSADKPDYYYGCLHNLNKVESIRKMNKVVMIDAIQKTLDFYAA